ncbi:platelet-activating factor acetylhydrolase [Ctenodactylus gundi]
MAPPRLSALLCICSGLALVHPFDWQDLNPVAHMKSSAWLLSVQELMAAASLHPTKIPRGSGPYSVGCTDIMVDHTEQGTFLRLYYPSQDEGHLDTVWIPNQEYFWGLSKALERPSVLGKLLNLLFGSVTVPAGWTSPLRSGEKYPLIIFSHGLGGFRTVYSAIGVELASYGFIVAAVEHRDESASATYYFQDESAAETGNRTWIYFKTVKREEAKAVRSQQVLGRRGSAWGPEHGRPEATEQSCLVTWEEREGTAGVPSAACLCSRPQHLRSRPSSTCGQIRGSAGFARSVRQRARECSHALSLILDIDDGRPVRNVLDLKFDLGQLKGAVDRTKLAVIGHSFGGATVIEALSEDQRFRCGIALDAWMLPVGHTLHSRVPQPLFFINSERFQSAEDTAAIKKFYQPDRERKMISIRGSVHSNFVDFTFTVGKAIGHILRLKGDIDSKVALSLTNKASLAFLQKYLGLDKGFDQWNGLMDGEDDSLIPGPNPGAVTPPALLRNSRMDTRMHLAVNLETRQNVHARFSNQVQEKSEPDAAREFFWATQMPNSCGGTSQPTPRRGDPTGAVFLPLRLRVLKALALSCRPWWAPLGCV